VKLLRSVAIAGVRANGWIDHFNAPGTEVWSLNMAHRTMLGVKFHAYFELHRRQYLQSYEPDNWKERVAWVKILKRKDCPFYTFEPWPEAKTNRLYPKREVEALTPHGTYHLGSFDWMVAFAILQGFEAIKLYGVDFSRGGEPIGARACLEYWLGIAEGRGIAVEVFGNGDVFKTYQLLRSEKQYGAEDVHLVEEDAGQGWVRDLNAKIAALG
jgi:hypothetical protein